MWIFRSYILFLIFYAMGICFYSIHLLLVHILFLISSFIVFYANRKYGVYLICLFLVFESGMGDRYLRERTFVQDQSHVRPFTNQYTDIEGEVITHPVPSNDGYSFLVRTSKIKDQNQSFIIQILSKAEVDLEKYDQIRFRSKMYMISNPNNLQKIKHIQAYGRISSHGQIDIAHSANSIFTQIRNHIFKIARQNLSEKNFYYYRVMVFGDQALLSEQTMARLKETGLLHLFVISASHIACVGSLGFWLTRIILGWIPAFYRRRNMQLLLKLGSVGLVFFFLQLINPPISTFRAMVTMLLYFVLKAIHRSQNPLWSLGLVFFLTIIVDPLYLFDVSTQLTFASVAGILTAYFLLCVKFNPNVIDRSFVLRWMWKITAITLGATVVTAPILYFHFHQFYIASFFYNLVIVPTIGELLSIVSILSLAWALLPIEWFQQIGFSILEQLFNGFERLLYFDVRTELYTLLPTFSRPAIQLFLFSVSIGIVLLILLSRNRKQNVRY